MSYEQDEHFWFPGQLLEDKIVKGYVEWERRERERQTALRIASRHILNHVESVEDGGEAPLPPSRPAVDN